MTRTQDDYLSKVLRLEQPLRAICTVSLRTRPISRTCCGRPICDSSASRRSAGRISEMLRPSLLRRRATSPWTGSGAGGVVSIETVDDLADLPAADDIAGLAEIVTHTSDLCISPRALCNCRISAAKCLP
jgi:hypothetical protein